MSHVVNSIYEHEFIKQLATGHLDAKIFRYYLEQDAYYLYEFSRCLSVIASKCEKTYTAVFISMAKEALSELDVIHEYFVKYIDCKNIAEISPANLFYTSYLRSVCSMEAVSVGIASVIPCFWVYYEVGKYLSANNIRDNNPYSKWISAYTGENFKKAADTSIRILDEYSLRESEQTQKKMQTAFFNSTKLELMFWDDAYHLRTFSSI